MNESPIIVFAVEYMPCTASVQFDSAAHMGKTCWSEKGAEHEVAFRVDVPRFFEHYFSVVQGET